VDHSGETHQALGRGNEVSTTCSSRWVILLKEPIRYRGWY